MAQVAAKRLRGVDSRTANTPQSYVRDVRPLSQKFLDTLRNPRVALMAMLFAAGGAFFFPVASDPILVVAGTYFVWYRSLKSRLPLRLPATSGLPDYGDLAPGSNKPRPAQGIFFLGNERDSGEEIWLSNSDARTHMLLLGTTGGGKTEALVSMASNAIAWGSGLIYVDGKGDTSLWLKIYSLARRYGREQDLLVLNFMKGSSDAGGSSNTMNPFAAGSSSVLTEMLVSLMDESGSEGGMWKGRAISLMTALMRPLTELRDGGHFLLNVDVIRKSLDLDKIIALYLHKDFTLGQGHNRIHLPEGSYRLSHKAKDALYSYLSSLPGFSWQKAAEGKPQGGTTMDQHGYLFMQYTKLLGELADTYDYIFDTPLGEIDLEDVVLNRRIVVVLLPALEKSEDSIRSLGKIVVANLKAMMGKALGSEIEGDTEIVIKNKPTNAPSPFMAIFDEVGYYTVPGMAVMAAQARSLGFQLIFAAQDLPAMKKTAKEEADSIIANCNTKVIMKLEDPGMTWEMVSKSFGETTVVQTSGFTGNAGGIGLTFQDMMNAGLDKRSRGDFLDLKAQAEGEAHVMFADQLLRARLFYANPPEAKRLRRNHFLRVRAPGPSNRKSDERREHDEVLRRLSNPAFTLAGQDEPPATRQNEAGILRLAYDIAGTQRRWGPVERAAVAVAAALEAIKRAASWDLPQTAADDAERAARALALEGPSPEGAATQPDEAHPDQLGAGRTGAAPTGRSGTSAERGGAPSRRSGADAPGDLHGPTAAGRKRDAGVRIREDTERLRQDLGLVGQDVGDPDLAGHGFSGDLDDDTLNPEVLENMTRLMNSLDMADDESEAAAPNGSGGSDSDDRGALDPGKAEREAPVSAASSGGEDAAEDGHPGSRRHPTSAASGREDTMRRAWGFEEMQAILQDAFDMSASFDAPVVERIAGYWSPRGGNGNSSDGREPEMAPEPDGAIAAEDALADIEAAAGIDDPTARENARRVLEATRRQAASYPPETLPSFDIEPIEDNPVHAALKRLYDTFEDD